MPHPWRRCHSFSYPSWLEKLVEIFKSEPVSYIRYHLLSHGEEGMKVRTEKNHKL
ncbi:unnamed protein product [Brassica oleracea var. botrytis]